MVWLKNPKQIASTIIKTIYMKKKTLKNFIVLLLEVNEDVTYIFNSSFIAPAVPCNLKDEISTQNFNSLIRNKHIKSALLVGKKILLNFAVPYSLHKHQYENRIYGVHCHFYVIFFFPIN